MKVYCWRASGTEQQYRRPRSEGRAIDTCFRRPRPMSRDRNMFSISNSTNTHCLRDNAKRLTVFSMYCKISFRQRGRPSPCLQGGSRSSGQGEGGPERAFARFSRFRSIRAAFSIVTRANDDLCHTSEFKIEVVVTRHLLL